MKKLPANVANQSGFSAIEIAVSIVVLALIVFVVFKVLHVGEPGKKFKSSSTTISTTTSQASSTTTSSSGNKTTTTPNQPATKSLNPASSSHQVPTPTPVTQPPAQSSLVGTATELYRVLSDGTTAQESPVSITLSGVNSVQLKIDLQCSGACQFKLASDNYPLDVSAIYTSSQTITYTISRPGNWIFYNSYTPNTKFSLKF